MVIKALVFDSSITNSPVFTNFVAFIIKNSVKMHMVSSHAISRCVKDDTPFFDHGCRRLDADYHRSSDIRNVNHLDHVTSLTCNLAALQDIWQKIKLQDLVSLTELRIVMDFTTERGVSEPVSVIETSPELLQEVSEMNIRHVLSIKVSDDNYTFEDVLTS
ncbi:unnamed protein product [Ambrosiozyma monospora]|uniref:Unnamed protein product n=1 Tax=Ambrosiozyma monospora TaxID=43982 RepID=A0ACB5U1Z2_AMBMO|nr:unnamed protein product [Ambrosiozyma monospora]